MTILKFYKGFHCDIYCLLCIIWRRQWHPTPVLLPGKSPGRLQSMGSLRVGHDWAASLSLFTVMQWHDILSLEKEMATHSSVLAWRIPGTADPGGLLSMGSHRVRHDWSDLAADVFLELSCFFDDPAEVGNLISDSSAFEHLEVYSSCTVEAWLGEFWPLLC